MLTLHSCLYSPFLLTLRLIYTAVFILSPSLLCINSPQLSLFSLPLYSVLTLHSCLYSRSLLTLCLLSIAVFILPPSLLRVYSTKLSLFSVPLYSVFTLHSCLYYLSLFALCLPSRPRMCKIFSSFITGKIMWGVFNVIFHYAKRTFPRTSTSFKYI